MMDSSESPTYLSPIVAALRADVQRGLEPYRHVGEAEEALVSYGDRIFAEHTGAIYFKAAETVNTAARLRLLERFDIPFIEDRVKNFIAPSRSRTRITTEPDIVRSIVKGAIQGVEPVRGGSGPQLVVMLVDRGQRAIERMGSGHHIVHTILLAHADSKWRIRHESCRVDNIRTAPDTVTSQLAPTKTGLSSLCLSDQMHERPHAICGETGGHESRCHHGQHQEAPLKMLR